MRPLKRERHGSQYCGPTDNPKHTELFHDRSSILDNRALCYLRHLRCQSFLLAMSGHAGPIQMDLGVTPVVQRISCGQAVALLKGRRACRADLTSLGTRASDGGRGAAMVGASAGVVVAWGNGGASSPKRMSARLSSGGAVWASWARSEVVV